MSRQQPRPYCRQGWTLRLLFLAKKPSPARGARVLQTAHPLYNELGFILITCKAHQPVIPSPVILNREEPAQGWFGFFSPFRDFCPWESSVAAPSWRMERWERSGTHEVLSLLLSHRQGKIQQAKERAGVCDDDDDNGDDDDHDDGDDDDHDDDEGDRYPKRFQHILKRQRYPWPWQQVGNRRFWSPLPSQTKTVIPTARAAPKEVSAHP